MGLKTMLLLLLQLLLPLRLVQLLLLLLLLPLPLRLVQLLLLLLLVAAAALSIVLPI